MRFLKWSVCLPLLAIYGAAAAPPEHATDVEAAIDARERAFEACVAKHDAACVVNGFYVSDANEPIASPSGGHPPVRGRAELIKMFEASFKELRAIKLKRVQVIRRGDLAAELGLSTVTLQSGQTVNGRFSVLWLREADGWRVKLDFFADDGWKE
jgi:ketosteroid isomerase-like protein